MLKKKKIYESFKLKRNNDLSMKHFLDKISDKTDAQIVIMPPAYPPMTDPCPSIRGIYPKSAEPSCATASVAVLVTKLGWEETRNCTYLIPMAMIFLIPVAICSKIEGIL